MTADAPPQAWLPDEVVTLAGGADVVDLACGDGALARWLVDRAGAASVLALDLDPALLERARGLLVDGGHGRRVHVEQADLEQLTLPFEAYDLALAPGVLATTTDPVRAARMVRAGLRPYGLLVALVPSAATDPVVAALRVADLDQVTTARSSTARGCTVVTARKPPRRRG